MDLAEFKLVKNYSYREYCDYLQNKYGLPTVAYFNKNWNKNQKVTRTKEGLFVHHKYEDTAIKLSDKAIAPQYPYEWQDKENLVYCDYLEHFFLHILIWFYPAPDARDVQVGGISIPVAVGITGAKMIGRQLNDFYSGWFASADWMNNCFYHVRDDEDTYIEIYKYIISKTQPNKVIDMGDKINKEFLKSASDGWGCWYDRYDLELYAKIKKVVAESIVKRIINGPRKLSVIRERLGLSMEQFAERYKIPLEVIQNWEQGEEEIPDYIIALITQIIKYEIRLNYL